MNNLVDLPKIYYINLKRSSDRRDYIENHFLQFKINKYQRIDAEDLYSHQSLSFLKNGLPRGLKPVEAVVVLSHIKALEEFLKSGEEWCLIFEDDIDLSTSDYWNFSWKEFFDNIPKNSKIVQLVVATRKTMQLDFHFHQRKFWDFNATGYLISAQHAKDVLSFYLEEEKINLHKYAIQNEYDSDNTISYSQERYATIEEVLYGINKNDVYSAPIFGYTMQFESISNPEHYEQSLNSHNRVADYWKNKHKNFSLQEFMRIQHV